MQACSESQRKKLTRDHTQPKTWHHSGGSLPAGDGSHSTDQPNRTENGQAGLSVWFSQAIPERQTSKTEYANTQQGLTVYLTHN
jgi:hypothetical protein